MSCAVALPQARERASVAATAHLQRVAREGLRLPGGVIRPRLTSDGVGGSGGVSAWLELLRPVEPARKGCVLAADLTNRYRGHWLRRSGSGA